MTLALFLLIVGLVCFLVEAFRANFRQPPPTNPPRFHISFGWLGLACWITTEILVRTGHSGHL